MSETRLKLRVSSFHKKLMEQQAGVISAEKKESGVISIEKEMKEVHLEQKDIKTPKERISGFRNIESLLENPKKKENEYKKEEYRKDEEYISKRNEEEKEEEIEKRYIPMEEDFPELMEKKEDEKEEKKSCWNNFKKDVDEIRETVSEINKKMRDANMEELKKNEIINRDKMREQAREERVEEYIKKVKKNYDKEYIVYDMETYIQDELQYYMDDDDITLEYILYEEMFDEVRNRDFFLDIFSYDHEHYYKYYDLESKYYEKWTTSPLDPQGDIVPL